MSEPRVTLADVARKAGVSTQTVSRVINNKREISEETRQRVLKVIQELGYRPNRIARSLVTQQTFTIGLLIPDIANPFYSEVTRGAEDAAWDCGYNVLLCNTDGNPQREVNSLQLLEETQADGVIIVSPRMETEKLFPLLENFHAAVLVNRQAPAEIAGVARVDDFEGGFMAVSHLIEQGRQNIGFLAGPSDIFSGLERVRGGQAALEAAGLPFHSEWCLPGSLREGGYRLTRELLYTYPEINALVCFNDVIAVDALNACKEMGLRIPEDIALVGFDDTTMARFVSPALTTLGVNKETLGASAARLLLDRLQGKAVQGEVILKPQLIIRDSTP